MSCCIPCKEAGVQAAATRIVPVLKPGARRAVNTPMCTPHASKYWKPITAIVSPITQAGAPRFNQRICACGCKQPLPDGYGKIRFNKGHRAGRLQLGQEIA